MVLIEGVGLSDIRPPPPGEVDKNGADKDSKKETTDNTDGGQSRVHSSGGIPEWVKSTLPRTGGVLHHSLEVVAPSAHGRCPVEELLEVKIEKTMKRVIEEGEYLCVWT